MMKNAFYFTLKTLIVLKIFKFCIEFSVMSKNGLTNISKSKDNQAMKFGQLIEHNIKFFF